MEEQTEKSVPKKTRVNFRPLLFCAVGLAAGICLYGKCRFGGAELWDFLFLPLLLLLALPPFSVKRTAALLVCVLLFGGAGALGAHLYAQSFCSALPAGEYRLAGTVVSVAERQGYSVVYLEKISLGGEEQGGQCRLILGGEAEVLPADMLVLTASVSPVTLEGFSRDPFVRSDYAKNVRYTANASSFEKTGRSQDPFLRLNASLYSSLHANMGRDEADVSYALLTGNGNVFEEGVSDAVRRGGIAHIFAVSGLHIGILFGAAYALSRPLGKYRFLPALGVALLYTALCNFTVSSVRALIMCGAAEVVRAFGKKNDMLSAISLAAIAVLLFLPAQWYAAGMRLSFGACIGLFLFAGSLGRLFARLRLPRFLGGYLSSSLAVWLFVLPVTLDCFGYLSVWGWVLNLFLIPALPVLFLGTLVCALAALTIPPAAFVFLSPPRGWFTLLLRLLAAAEPLAVIAGFSLGGGSAVILLGCVGLSQRVRFSAAGRGVLASALCVLFTLAVLTENVVFAGCRIDIYRSREAQAALVSTRTERVLLIDGDISLSDCEDFLNRTYGGTLDAVVVLSEDELGAFNVAAFLGAEEVRGRDEQETGFRGVPLAFGETFSYGGLSFRYLTRHRLLLFAEGCAVEIAFGGSPVADTDLFLDGAENGARYFLRAGEVRAKRFG